MPPMMIKQVIGAAAGLIIGLMLLFLGLFRTLLLVILGGLGWWLCGSRTIPQPVKDFLARIKNTVQ